MRRSPLLVIYLTVFVDLLGFGIILPILPYYAERFGATGVWVGVILTAYSAAQFVSAPILGRWSDRVGRRPVILLSLAGSAISLVLTGLAGGLFVLIAARALAGLFGGSITTAQAYIADVTRPEERTKAMGLLGASIGMGFVLGPAIGAGLSGFGFATAAFVAAAIAAVNLAIGFRVLTESRQPGQTRARPAARSLSSLPLALGQPAIGRILIATFLGTFAFVSMEATFALFGERRLGLNASSLGLVFTVVGIVIALVQGGLLGRLNARFSSRALAVAGAVIMGISLMIIPFVPSLALAIVVLCVTAIGQGLLTPTLSSLLSLAAPENEQGTTLGLGQSLSAGARAIGPLVAGALFDLGISLPYVVAGVLGLTVALVLRGLPSQRLPNLPQR